MNTSLDGVLIFRLPGNVRADLDKAAVAAGEKRSAFARRGSRFDPHSALARS